MDAAIAIADSEGAEAVFMRRIAQLLQAGAMSLYWHLANREHLLELMLDALMADVEVPEPTGDWQADLRVQARSTRKVLLRHKWVIDFVTARPRWGPTSCGTWISRWPRSTACKSIPNDRHEHPADHEYVHLWRGPA